ncbi:damage-inducible protein DinB [Flavobacterium arcticum]|uniref:Damage-inducible protein DinB n=1 Tax=Flavobacterium arcticum TaxID=1784713 RepID=A0A345HBA7_9FLAO|nr:DinB family protein [Flavobacterium arcticum]AXG73867.1 damage-inducible protein DinB [Flavobacterium arcticum]KAF2511820.1 damage-inducible protein DinB [Flavobacterium arcticum]
MENNTATLSSTVTVITPEILLKHWQGHRALTRRVIAAFPEKELFNYSIGGMRPFARLAMEMIDLAGPGMQGFVTNEWDKIEEMPHHTGEGMPETKAELLELWDEITRVIDDLWGELTPHRFAETVVAFGQYENPVYSTILYFVDNEIHHRGQGYVYLRSLNIEPPFFWER